MLDPFRRYIANFLWPIVGLIVVIGMAGGMTSAHGFRQCEQYQGQYPTPQNNYNKSSSILIPDPSIVDTWLSCAGGFTNENGGAISALATIALVFSTIMLWGVTRRSAVIAERGLTELERPWIFVTDSDPDGVFTDQPFVRLQLCNYGRTIGEIRSIRGAVRRTTAQDIEVGTMPLPVLESSDVGNIVPPGGAPYTGTLKFPAPKEPNATEFIRLGTYRFILRAEIHYTGLLKEPGITAFCFLYDASKHQFARYGGEKYNYTRRKLTCSGHATNSPCWRRHRHGSGGERLDLHSVAKFS